MKSKRVEFLRRDAAADDYFEIKDPSIVRAADGTYLMFATNGISRTEPWVVGRFSAASPEGPWQELEPCNIKGVEGPEVVAPSVVLTEKDGKPLWKMYIQTSCFGADGVIALATSTDGINFTGVEEAPMTKENLPKGSTPVIGLYDVAISDVTKNGKSYDLMTFSAYREIGNGDVFVALRDKAANDEIWTQPRMSLRQEDVPFHNKPGSSQYEWGLEGAKVIQLAEDTFLMVGVCFLDKDKSQRGTRQRVFFAAASDPQGPFLPMSTPVEPTAYPEGTGENGHPDTIDLGDKIGLMYQERAGEGRDKPWHLRYAEIPKDELLRDVQARLEKEAAPEMPAKKSVNGPRFRP